MQYTTLYYNTVQYIIVHCSTVQGHQAEPEPNKPPSEVSGNPLGQRKRVSEWGDRRNNIDTSRNPETESQQRQ